MIKIHVGCGKRDFGPEWIHIDGEDHGHIIDADIWLTHFKKDSADIIYSSHMLEYFDRVEGFDLLKRWHWVLKPEGILRIAVPDFEGLFEARLKGFGLDDLIGPLFGKMPMNNRFIYHKTVYDFISLKRQLEMVGFKDVHRYDWRKTEHAHIDDHSRAHLPHDPEAISTGNFTDKPILISLNVEAIK